METMTATNYVSVPHAHHTATSQLRDLRQSPAILTTTRTVQPGADMQQPALSAPASQESIASVQSAGSSVPASRLNASGSDLSQLTNYTDLTSPLSSAPSNTTQDIAAHLPKHTHISRQRTPENANQTSHLNGESALASPMSITSPVMTNGTKRTASGHVKNAPSLPGTPYTSMFPGRESRRESISSSGSKAGELAATLKTRLGYAMAKVQNGWEHKSLQEVEQLAAQCARSNRYSMSHVDQYRPGTGGLSIGTSALSMYDNYSRGGIDATGPPASKRHSGNYGHFTYSASQPTYRTDPAHGLQPAADIRATSSLRTYPAPSLSQPVTHPNGMSPPRTPVNAPTRRPPTIRTETQTMEAERDALQALFQLGSPHTSQLPRSATAFSSQASPPKSTLDTPRRVTFARSESNSSARPSSPENSEPAEVRPPQ